MLNSVGVDSGSGMTEDEEALDRRIAAIRMKNQEIMRKHKVLLKMLSPMWPGIGEDL